MHPHPSTYLHVLYLTLEGNLRANTGVMGAQPSWLAAAVLMKEALAGDDPGQASW